MRRFETRFTARASDIDELGHVNNAVWVRWVQDLELTDWHALGVTVDALRARYLTGGVTQVQA